MLEGSGDELAGCLRCMHVADARLCIPLQFMQRHVNTFTVRLAHTIIATHKCRERDGLRCGERRIPSCAMLGACNLLAVAIVVSFCGLMLDELRVALRMPPFAQTSKLFSAYTAMQTPLFRQRSLPLAIGLPDILYQGDC
jgi:hypothetical protein